MCGASAEDRALEADHIIPRSLGGTDDRSNLQALCYRCNAMKGDRDATDFRKVRESYSHREPGCPFCDLEPARVIAENELAVALEDAFPVTRLHALVVPRRHVNDLFDLGIPEVRACHGLLSEVRQQILAQDPTVLAFNVGVNTGAEAGQTVPHCHYHLIPRRIGDVPNPRGGIRNVIPGMGDY